MLFQEQYRDYFPTAVNRQESFSPLSFLCFPGRTFHSRLITQAWLTRCCCALSWPDCTLSPPERLLLMDRPVTQSIATQQDIYDLVEPTVWSQWGFASHTWNFDRFHQSCLFRKSTAETILSLGVACQPRTTVCHLHQFYLDKAQNYYLALIKLWLFCLKKELNSNYNLKQSIFKCFFVKNSTFSDSLQSRFLTIAGQFSYYHGNS